MRHRLRPFPLLLLLAALLFAAGCERTAPQGGGGTAPVAAPEAKPAPPPPEAPVVLFLGDSLTAGFGLEQEDSFPAVLQRRMKAEGYPHRVVNAGVSGDTSRGGLGRTDWLLRQAPHVVVLALGANDGLRGQSPEEMRANLAAIIEKFQAAGARVMLAGMKLPRNLGPDYLRRFEAVFPEVAEKFGLPFLPFLLEGVAGQRSLNQGDGLHPNAEGAKIVADNVWAVLKPLLK